MTRSGDLKLVATYGVTAADLLESLDTIQKTAERIISAIEQSRETAEEAVPAAPGVVILPPSPRILHPLTH